MAALQDAYYQMPVITRSYMTACFFTTLACQLEVIAPLNLYFNWKQVVEDGQFWRMLTNFLYFGNFGIDYLFHMFFLVRYCRALEEGSFRGRSGDFFWMLLLGSMMMMLIAVLLPWLNVMFLGASLTFMMVYIWGRRNPSVAMSFLGLFSFTAGYLPWVLLGFSLLLGHNIQADLIGIACGHVYYFLEDVYPTVMADGGMGGPRMLAAPAIVTRIFDGPVNDPNYVAPPPGQRAGGFQWGQGRQLGGEE
eukprot:gene6703-29951_t